MSPITKQDLIAGGLPDDVLLGWIVPFTITDEPTEHRQLAAWFDELGLDPAILPPQPKPVDAFRKATSEAKEKYVLPDGSVCTVLCRDVDSNENMTRRQITREVRKPKAKEPLSYTRAIEVVFWRGQSKPVTDASGAIVGRAIERGSERFQIKVNREGLDADELRAITEIAELIRLRYLSYYDHLDGNRIRAVIRDYIKHLRAIEIKPGLYFVHASRSTEIRALQELVRRIGGGCFMHMIPLVDLEEQRDMVTAAFKRESAQALAEVAKEARELAQSGSITPAAYARIKDRYDEITEKAKEHMQALQLSTEVTESAAQVAHAALVDIQKALVA